MEFFAFFGITIIFPMQGIYRSLLALWLPTTEVQARFWSFLAVDQTWLNFCSDFQHLAMIYPNPCYASDFLSPSHDMIDAIIIVTLRTTTAMTMAMAAIAAIRGEAQIPGLLLPQWNGWQGHVISWGPWWGGLFKVWRNETCKDDFKTCGTQQVIGISIPKQHQSLTLGFQKTLSGWKICRPSVNLGQGLYCDGWTRTVFFSGNWKRGPKWRFFWQYSR